MNVSPHKVLKRGRWNLTHVQNSILEGEISAGDLATLQPDWRSAWAGRVDDYLWIVFG